MYPANMLIHLLLFWKIEIVEKDGSGDSCRVCFKCSNYYRQVVGIIMERTEKKVYPLDSSAVMRQKQSWQNGVKLIFYK